MTYLHPREQESIVLQGLEDLSSVVFLRHGLQLLHICHAVSSDGVLISRRVAHVQEWEA